MLAMPTNMLNFTKNTLNVMESKLCIFSNLNLKFETWHFVTTISATICGLGLVKYHSHHSFTFITTDPERPIKLDDIRRMTQSQPGKRPWWNQYFSGVWSCRCTEAVIRNKECDFLKFTGKHPCWSYLWDFQKFSGQ